VEKLLAKDPAERYQHADDVAVDLRALVREALRPSVAVPPALTARARKRRWLGPALGIVALAAAAVFGALQWRAPDVHAPLPSKVPEANEYFQRAMLFMNEQQDLPRAREMLEKALALDPDFAHARAYYGLTHILLIDAGTSNDPSWLYKAEAELQQALEDDPKLAMTHGNLAMVYLYQGRKDLVVREAGRAIELKPDDRDAVNFLVLNHQLAGEYEQAHALLKRGLEREPLFLPFRANLGENFRQTGNPAASIREQEKALEQDPKYVSALIYVALARLTEGDTAKASEALERARTLEPRNYQVRLLWALTLAVEGRREDALREMDDEVLKYGELLFFTSNVAEFYAVLGDRAKALAWLDRAVRAGDERAEWFERDPLLATLRQEPLFRQIVDGIRNRRRQPVGPVR
jgi:tetratricopeptide (TPR) repeat protein